ncbi:hypothetical protein ACH5RR_026339 [Cinchona calisaya]|uniref:Uncharacterized protein n=1 Tax=Cinchona calisaya TaxID=153742 RepID=A0ABD2Z5H8_9GENT
MRLETKREWMSKQDVDICPKVLKTLEKLKNDSTACIARFCGEEKFKREIDPEHGVHNYYKKDAYTRAYEPVINPTNGPPAWERSNEYHNLLPKKIKVSGRPKKARRREPGEVRTNSSRHQRLPRTGVVQMTCTNCHMKGHNTRKYPQKFATEDLSVAAPSLNSNKCSLCHNYGHNKRRCNSGAMPVQLQVPKHTEEQPQIQEDAHIELVVPQLHRQVTARVPEIENGPTTLAVTSLELPSGTTTQEMSGVTIHLEHENAVNPENRPAHRLLDEELGED